LCARRRAGVLFTLDAEGRARDVSRSLGAGRGTLLLADISGYTAFLQAVAGAHAADMAAGRFVPEAYPLLTSLLDGIVGRIAPPFVLSKLEGDAVFAFAAKASWASAANR
jgi:hypothetical protein